MLGYVTCEKPEMKMKDFELYSGYYCGVCKSIGRRYGQLPRMVLSYDAAFLGVVLSAVSGEEIEIEGEHCMVHPVKKKIIVKSEAVDYAADVMVILAWYNLMDDIRDGRGFHLRILKLIVSRKCRRAREKHPELCMQIEDMIGRLHQLEEEHSASIDDTTETFARVMEKIFTLDREHPEGEERILARLGFHLGKWIYLIDALDDLEEDIKVGNYNPLVHRYEFDGQKEDAISFRKRISTGCERNLLIYLSEMGNTIDLLDMIRNKDIIENVVYMGLLRRTENLLEKGKDGE